MNNNIYSEHCGNYGDKILNNNIYSEHFGNYEDNIFDLLAICCEFFKPKWSGKETVLHILNTL